MLVGYEDSEDEEAEDPMPFSMPAIAQHNLSEESDDEAATSSAIVQPPVRPAAVASQDVHVADPSALPSAEDFDALGGDAGVFLTTALVAEPGTLHVRAEASVVATSALVEPEASDLKVQGPRARPIWSFAEEKFGASLKKRKAESEQEARKHAGKAKGEFKKKSETSRGGDRAPARWD